MKFLKYVLLIIGIIIVVILVAALFIPKHYEVARSVTIQAPQALVMEQVKSLKKMNDWSPFIEQDPTIQITYAGTEGQVGSSSSWKSDKAGEGSQTITKLTDDRMESSLHFVKPMESTASAFFQTSNENGAVKATWGMQGENPYPFNIMCLFIDNMVGKDYEKGLNKLKTKCEEMNKNAAVQQ